MPAGRRRGLSLVCRKRTPRWGLTVPSPFHLALSLPSINAPATVPLPRSSLHSGLSACLLALATIGCDERSDTAASTPQNRQGSSHLTESTSARPSKSPAREERQRTVHAGVLRKIEKALETKAHDEAIEGFRELFIAREQAFDEVLALAKEKRETKDPATAATLKKLEDRINELSTLIAETQFALRNGDVDLAAIDTVLKEHSERTARFGIIRELQNIRTGD